MTETGDGNEFRDFISLLPQEYEIALTSDNVATAFLTARRAGWRLDALAQESAGSLARGGVGLVVKRLRTLAENPPARRRIDTGTRTDSTYVGGRPECAACSMPYSQRTTAVEPGKVCSACGAPLVLEFYRATR